MTTKEGDADDECQPSPLSCHLSCPHASLSDATQRPLRPTLADAGRDYERHRGGEEHAAAPHRDEGPRWQQTREPRQTLCEMARQRPYLGGDGFCAVCRDLMNSLSPSDARVGDGWQCRGA